MPEPILPTEPTRLVELPAVERLIERFDRLDESQLRVLVASWHATSRREHERAWEQVRDVAARSRLNAALDEVTDRAINCANRGSNTPAMPYSLLSENAWLELRREAAPALVDVAIATALAGRLPDTVHDTLIGPWLRATAM